MVCVGSLWPFHALFPVSGCLTFTQPICGILGADGWKTDPAVHFSNEALKQAGYPDQSKRLEAIMELRPYK